MSNLTRAMMMGAAGAASGDKVYVDDVFSTYLYTGNNTARSINNGIDLSGEGGLVWIKGRDLVNDHRLYDTTRSTSPGPLSSSSGDAVANITSGMSGFNNNGFDLGIDDSCNYNNKEFVSWTFRKAPGFFDVVTYTGNGTAGKTISHSLGSVPGMIVIKKTSGSTNFWIVGHRSITLGTGRLILNGNFNNSTSNAADYWDSTAATSSVFTVGTHDGVNTNGETYVAYIFAHDDQSFGTDENESIIKCGSYAGTGSTDNTINLGFEPQWVMIKNISASGNWMMLDNMRGVATSSGSNDFRLWANITDAESGYDNAVDFTSTGFKMMTGAVDNTSGESYIYIAIRRPHKPPTAATEVFDDVAYTGNGSTGQDITISPSFADSVLIKRRTAGDNWGWANRLTGRLKHTSTNNTNQEATRAAADAVDFDRMSAFGLVGSSSGEVNSNNEPLISYSFKRAPGFFDVVAYSGGGSATKNHNLAAVPELMIVKVRNANGQWYVYSSTTGTGKYSLLSSSAAAATGVTWGVASSNFTVFAGANGSGENYIAYLFATLPGISKIGSYSGSSSAVDVDCGFTNGARFVLIKRTDQSGNWYTFDAARGIVSGNDPSLWINSNNAEVTNTDYIDPLSSGFTATTASGDINESGGTYIFLAIA